MTNQRTDCLPSESEFQESKLPEEVRQEIREWASKKYTREGMVLVEVGKNKEWDWVKKDDLILLGQHMIAEKGGDLMAWTEKHFGPRKR